jgi:acyl-CoA synthetase (AMP-forming)/AMP-acid ligase II/thioesterase domain-containing protein
MTACPSFPSLADALLHQAQTRPDAVGVTFIEDGRESERSFSFAALDVRARAIAQTLLAQVAPGERALLTYPPGLEFVAAFFGCLYAGIVPVPVFPPDPTRLARTVPRFQAVAADSRAAIVVTSQVGRAAAGLLFAHAPELAKLPWLATDAVDDAAGHGWRRPNRGLDALAFLQFTSGSTGTPRGIEVGHAHVLANCAQMHATLGGNTDLGSRFVSWLPLYHDFGLITALLYVIVYGASTVLMSPVDFLRDPLAWLRAMTRHRATVTATPNFGLELCARRATPAALVGLDLSSLELVILGGEPTRADTLARFATTFAPCGFRREALLPAYGLAECVVVATTTPPGRGPRAKAVDPTALEAGMWRPDATGRELVSAGPPLEGVSARIVDTGTGRPQAPGRVGEIWLSGPNVTGGYWNRPDETTRAFGARLDDGRGPFLRTGDLGIIDEGELYVTGRLKDLVIVRGRNLYPQDLERTVETAHAAIRPGSVAAFGVDDGREERVVVVAEVELQRSGIAPDIVATAVRGALSAVHEVSLGAIALIAPRTIHKTSSGKIERRACREAFLAGSLERVFEARYDAATPSTGTDADLVQRELRAVAPERRAATLLALLRAEAAAVLGLPVADVAVDRPLVDYGLSSVQALELGGRVSGWFEPASGLDALALFKAPSLERLAAELAEGVPAGAALARHRIDGDGRGDPGWALRRLIEAGATIERQGDSLWVELQPRADAAALVALASSAAATLRELLAADVCLSPMSESQRILCLQSEVFRDPGCHLAVVVDLDGPLDAGRLGVALTELVGAHEVLRASFPTIAGTRVQRVGPAHPVALRRIDGVEVDDFVAEERRRPFDLAAGPLLRPFLIARGPAATLVVIIHHAVCDAQSIAILLRELFARYEQPGRSGAMAPPYRAFALDQLRRNSAAGEENLAHFRTQLSGCRFVPLVAGTAGRPGIIRLAVASAQSARWAAAAQHRAGLPSLALAALAVALREETGAGRFAVGTVINQRLAVAGADDAIGDYCNFLPVALDLDDVCAAGDVLTHAHTRLSATVAHSEISPVRLIQELARERQLERPALYNVLLNVVRAPALPALAGGLAARLRLDALLQPTALTDAMFVAALDGAEPGLACLYQPGALAPEHAEALLGAWRRAFDRIVDEPRAQVRRPARRPVLPVCLAGGEGDTGIWPKLKAALPARRLLVVDYPEPLPETVEALADALLEPVVGAGGGGPLVLVGYSFGGFVAHELARRVVERGGEPPALALLDVDLGLPRSVAHRAALNDPARIAGLVAEFFVRRLGLPPLDEAERAALATAPERALLERLGTGAARALATQALASLQTLRRSLAALGRYEPAPVEGVRAVLDLRGGSTDVLALLDPAWAAAAGPTPPTPAELLYPGAAITRCRLAGADHFAIFSQPHVGRVARALDAFVAELSGPG